MRIIDSRKAYPYAVTMGEMVFYIPACTVRPSTTTTPVTIEANPSFTTFQRPKHIRSTQHGARMDVFPKTFLPDRVFRLTR